MKQSIKALIIIIGLTTRDVSMLRTFKPSQGKFGDGNNASVYLTMGVTVRCGSMSSRRYGTSLFAVIPKIAPLERLALEAMEQ